MLVNLDEGLGVSLVNKVPEELVFITLSGIDVHFTRTAANEVLELSIQSIQVSSLQLSEHSNSHVSNKTMKQKEKSKHIVHIALLNVNVKV